MILQLLAAYTASSQQVFNKFFWTIYKRWMYGSMHKLIPFIKLRNWFSWMWGKWIYGRNKDGWVLFICLCERACVCVCSWVRVCACACILSMHISTYAYTYVHMYVNSKIWSVILVNLHRIRIRDPPTWQLPSHVNQTGAFRDLSNFRFIPFFVSLCLFEWGQGGRGRTNCTLLQIQIYSSMYSEGICEKTKNVRTLPVENQFVLIHGRHLEQYFML